MDPAVVFLFDFVVLGGRREGVRMENKWREKREIVTERSIYTKTLLYIRVLINWTVPIYCTTKPPTAKSFWESFTWDRVSYGVLP